MTNLDVGKSDVIRKTSKKLEYISKYLANRKPWKGKVAKRTYICESVHRKPHAISARDNSVAVLLNSNSSGWQVDRQGDAFAKSGGGVFRECADNLSPPGG